MHNSLAAAADALTAELRSDGDPAPWPPTVWTQLHALVARVPGQLAHRGMYYRCDRCEYEWMVYLTIGLEGPEPLKELHLALPVPFAISCPSWQAVEPPESEPSGMKACGGTMTHVDWARDVVFNPLTLMLDDAPRFVLPTGAIGDDPPCGRLELPGPAFVRGRQALPEAS